MTTFLDLYNARRTIAENRQHDHIEKYQELHKFLVSLDKTDPYDLEFPTRLKFEDLSFFANQPFGREAEIPARDSFIYRICHIRDVVKGTEWRKDEGTDAANWKKVYDKGKGGWIRLGRFANGNYGCRPRRFSWWTTFPLYEDVITGAHRVGITNDWVAVQTVILRCPVDYVRQHKLALVPTIIDAFMQLIFHPTKDSISPKYGITIDLSLFPNTLTPGLDEIVLSALSVDMIEVKAINVDNVEREGKKQIFSKSEILSGLLEYYYQHMWRDERHVGSEG